MIDTLTTSARRTRPDFLRHLRVPLVAAPMLIASTPELVAATCVSGAIGAFPTANARSSEQLEAWFDKIDLAFETARDRGVEPAPYAPNLIVSRGYARRDDDLNTLIRRRPRVVITSVGSPASVIPALHDAGIDVWCDVATVRHAQHAIEAGVDGLILLSAGAGGHTGSANPFAFVRRVREQFDGVIALSGGLADGTALWAARALGCDLGYMGTRFLATAESGADEGHKRLVVQSGLDDIHLTDEITGLPTNVLRGSITQHGLQAEAFGLTRTGEVSTLLDAPDAPRRWRDLWGAGHSADGVSDVPSAQALVERITAEYHAARLSAAHLA